MKRISFLVLSVFITVCGFTQGLHLGIFGGLAAYNGDLTSTFLPKKKKVTNGAIGITANYELTDQIMLRSGLTYSIIGGADRFSNRADLVLRNLSFETSLLELSVLGEYYLFNLNDRAYSPYFFAGLAVFHFNPYAYDANHRKVYLKPLGTEGEGITGYPDRKGYSLMQIAIPVGGGVKFAVNDKLRIGVEIGLRKLFTDYLDDVSKNYISPVDLLTARGQEAVDISYRGDEVAGGDPNYPQKTEQRGNPKNKDAYYFTGIHLTYKLGGA